MKVKKTKRQRAHAIFGRIGTRFSYLIKFMMTMMMMMIINENSARNVKLFQVTQRLKGKR
jgi:hypothetical protein